MSKPHSLLLILECNISIIRIIKDDRHDDDVDMDDLQGENLGDSEKPEGQDDEHDEGGISLVTTQGKGETDDEEMEECDEELMELDSVPPPSRSYWRQQRGSSSHPSERSSIVGNRRSTASASGSTTVSRDDWYPLHRSESRKLELLYVPDPSRAMKRSRAEFDVAWIHRTLTPAQYDHIKELNDLYHHIRTTKDGEKVIINEWVCL